jgi:hypothetical protein
MIARHVGLRNRRDHAKYNRLPIEKFSIFNAGMGRPSKLTPELQARMIKMLRAGVHQETACKVAGLALSTYDDWLKRGGGCEPLRVSGSVTRRIPIARPRCKRP